MLILEKPNFPPYVCITCGVGTGRRWFVSLDFPIDNYFNPVHAGVVFQCNECWEELATKVAKAAQIYVIGMEPWDTGDYVEPTYDNTKELVKEVKFNGRDIPVEPRILAPVNSGSTESSNPEPSSDNPTTDTTSNDEPDGPVSEFRVFFGDGGNGGDSA